MNPSTQEYYNPNDSNHLFSIAIIDYENRIEAEAKATLKSRKASSLPQGSISPIDEYNKQFSIEDLLDEYNYTKDGNRWLHPDSTSKTPGIVLLDGLYFSHHSCDSLSDGHKHDAFDLFKEHEHNGDFKTALKAASDSITTTTGISIAVHNQQAYKASQGAPSTTTAQAAPFKPNTVDKNFMHEISNLQQRPYIIEKKLLRGYVSAMFSPGGTGKSVMKLAEAISVAIGTDLLGFEIKEQVNVLLINNEDDEEEMKRRIAGILQYHCIDPKELKNRFFYFSGYGCPLTIALREEKTVIASPDVKPLLKFMDDHKIGALFVDPFISTHDVNENDNNDIDKVVTQYKKIADKTKAAISLVHHTRKSDGDSEYHAGNAEIGRGASSLKDAARIIETLARMSPKTTKLIGMSSNEAHRHVRLDNGKLNFGITTTEASWFRMESVQIGNGDYVGVPKPVNLKPLFEAAKNDKGNKWTAITAAEAIDRIIGHNISVKWLDIRQKFMNENGCKTSQADSIRTKISDNASTPTRIKVGGKNIDYWTEKQNATAPIIIHKKAVPE